MHRESHAKAFEKLLTQKNREIVRKYILCCAGRESAEAVLEPFETNLGKPLSNAFFLHELAEVIFYNTQGYNFMEYADSAKFNNERNHAFKERPGPHIAATLSHCRYLREKAIESDLEVSLGTVIQCDPLSGSREKENIFLRLPGLRPNPAEERATEDFFLKLLMDENEILETLARAGSCKRYIELSQAKSYSRC